MERVWW